MSRGGFTWTSCCRAAFSAAADSGAPSGGALHAFSSSTRIGVQRSIRMCAGISIADGDVGSLHTTCQLVHIYV
jgi:hypothetical protein